MRSRQRFLELSPVASRGEKQLFGGHPSGRSKPSLASLNNCSGTLILDRGTSNARLAGTAHDPLRLQFDHVAMLPILVNATETTMDKKLAGLLGAVGALASLNTAQAAPSSDPTEVLKAGSFADLLEPIPNAMEKLQAIDETESSPKVRMAQFFVEHPPSSPSRLLPGIWTSGPCCPRLSLRLPGI